MCKSTYTCNGCGSVAEIEISCGNPVTTRSCTCDASVGVTANMTAVAYGASSVNRERSQDFGRFDPTMKSQIADFLGLRANGEGSGL